MKNTFLNAINEKKKVKVTFFSKDDGQSIARLCAPMDLGPSRRARNKEDRFHFWDYESDTTNHVLSLLPEQVINIEATQGSFNPSEFITWDVVKSPWFYSRDWGQYS